MLTDPDTLDGVECIMRGVQELNKFLDDIGWWRENLADDDTIESIVAKMPIPADKRDKLLADLERLGALGSEALLAGARLAVRSAEAIDVDWSPDGPSRAEVTAKGTTVRIVAHLDCEPAP